MEVSSETTDIDNEADGAGKEDGASEIEDDGGSEDGSSVENSQANDLRISVTKEKKGGSLTALDKNKPNSLPDIRPTAVGEALRCLVGKCLCAVTKEKASEYFAPLQMGVACPSGTEKIIHGLRHCVEGH